MRITRDVDGGADGISQRAQPAGTSRISLPVGLFQRRSWSQGNVPGGWLITGSQIYKTLVSDCLRQPRVAE